MDNSFLAIALLALATVLIVAEVFIPSGGLLAISMFASLAGSFYFAWIAWWDDSRTIFYAFSAFAIVCIPSVAILALALLPRTKFGKRLLLEGPSEEEVIPFAKEEEHLNLLVGKTAQTITPLIPGGMISINRERIHAFSEGVSIDSGVDVKIIKATGTRVLVREIQQDEKSVAPETAENKTAVNNDSTSVSTNAESQDPLDFDISNSE